MLARLNLITNALFRHNTYRLNNVTINFLSTSAGGSPRRRKTEQPKEPTTLDFNESKPKSSSSNSTNYFLKFAQSTDSSESITNDGGEKIRNELKINREEEARNYGKRFLVKQAQLTNINSARNQWRERLKEENQALDVYRSSGGEWKTGDNEQQVEKRRSEEHVSEEKLNFEGQAENEEKTRSLRAEDFLSREKKSFEDGKYVKKSYGGSGMEKKTSSEFRG